MERLSTLLKRNIEVDSKDNDERIVTNDQEIELIPPIRRRMIMIILNMNSLS